MALSRVGVWERCSWGMHQGPYQPPLAVGAERQAVAGGHHAPTELLCLGQTDLLRGKSIGFLPSKGRVPGQKELYRNC